MPQSTTLDAGMAVSKESMAAAYVAQEHGANVIFLGSIGCARATWKVYPEAAIHQQIPRLCV